MAENPNILEKGMVINVRGVMYKVVAVRPNGKITIKCKGSISDEEWDKRYAKG